MDTLGRRFLAKAIAPPGRAVGRRIGIWCPWCEAPHLWPDIRSETAHGAETVRAAHCHPGSSPVAGRTVCLTVDGSASTEKDLEPMAPYLAASGDAFHRRIRLADVLDRGRLSLALVRLLFGKNRPYRGFTAALVGGRAEIYGAGENWSLHTETGDCVADGEGLGTLVARLFGTTAGIAFTRVGIDTLGLPLSADCRRLIAALVDADLSGERMPVVECSPFPATEEEEG